MFSRVGQTLFILKHFVPSMAVIMGKAKLHTNWKRKKKKLRGVTSWNESRKKTQEAIYHKFNRLYMSRIVYFTLSCPCFSVQPEWCCISHNWKAGWPTPHISYQGRGDGTVLAMYWLEHASITTFNSTCLRVGLSKPHTYWEEQENMSSQF